MPIKGGKMLLESGILTIAEQQCLKALHGIGGRATITDVARAAVITFSHAIECTQRLEKRKYLESRKIGRRRFLTLTRRGFEYVKICGWK